MEAKQTSGESDREAFLAEAGRRYDELMGRTGSGESFDAIEESAERAGRKAILRLLEARLRAEESAGPEEAICPKCGGRMRRPAEGSPRHLETLSGTVRYERRHAICDQCSASFSPSGRAVEDPASGSVEPPPADRV